MFSMTLFKVLGTVVVHEGERVSARMVKSLHRSGVVPIIVNKFFMCVIGVVISNTVRVITHKSLKISKILCIWVWKPFYFYSPFLFFAFYSR